MNYPESGPGRRPDEQPFAFMRRRRQSQARMYATVALVGIAILAVGAGWYWMRTPADVDGPGQAAMDGAPDGTITPGTQPGAGAMGPGGSVPPLDLPSLSASDAVVREVVSRLSAHPQFARWLVTDSLVERFVGAVVDLAGGRSPNEHVEFLVPGEDFRVQSTGGSVVMDPAGYARYDLLVETFLSLDTEGAAQLYHQLHPLMEEAHAELGIPGRSFDDAMALAVANVLSARLPEGPFELELVEDRYEFRDPAIEEFTEAEKHLIRMGPNHAVRVQDKVEAIADRIRLPPL
jgi:hypothetical protein